MSRAAQPELKSQSAPYSNQTMYKLLMRAEYMDRRLFLHIQGGRKVSGVLRGFDLFLNLVIDQAHEELGGGERRACGMVVSNFVYSVVIRLTRQVIRGNSVHSMELVDNQKV